MSECAPLEEATPTGSKVILGASCTIHEAQALKAQLLQHLGAGPPFVIDGGAVERIDTAGVQTILAFALDCLERNLAFSWSARSEALTRAIALLSLAPLLESPGTSIAPSGGS
jgi:anti-anti-sigma regulatory factor